MLTLILLVLLAAPSTATPDSNREIIETLMDNVVVVRAQDDVSSRYVPLTCGEAYEDQPVVWKKNGELQPALQGNRVNVLVEEMDGGNYTCHLGPDGEYLNHTLIMIHIDPDNKTTNPLVILAEKSPEEGHIQCSAPNYQGSFHCTWTRTMGRSSAAVLLVKAERNLEKITCELEADGSGVQCQYDNCPYKEDQHRISLSIYIHSFSRVETYTKTFYLRDIVRPAKLPNLRLTEGKVFSWSYPDTWEKPCSYFGLQFQVKVVQSGHSCSSEAHIMHNITTEETQYKVKSANKKYVFCVRAQDRFTRGPFSHWSQCTVNKNNIEC